MFIINFCRTPNLALSYFSNMKFENVWDTFIVVMDNIKDFFFNKNVIILVALFNLETNIARDSCVFSIKNLKQFCIFIDYL